MHRALEGFFIVAGVLLGSGVGHYREPRQNRELARACSPTFQKAA
jgi:hypothetical protein